MLAGFMPVLAVASSEPAFSRTDFPVKGADGDSPGEFECPEGQVLGGFAGRYGVWIDQIRAMCAPIEPDGSYEKPGVAGPAFGGNGGAYQQAYCFIGSQLTGVSVRYTANDRQIAYIRLQCKAPPDDERRQSIVFGNSNYSADLGGLANMGRSLGSDSYQDCSWPERPVGFRVRFGRDVNAFGLNCARVKPPQSASAQGATAGSQTRSAPLPAAEARDTFTTRRSGGNARAVDADPRSLFTGTAWTVQVKPGRPFALVFYPGQKADELVGEMHLNDGRANGRVSGTIGPDGQTLTFSYSAPDPYAQPAMRGAMISGTGTLKSFGHVMGGKVTSSQGQVEWTGTRRP